LSTGGGWRIKKKRKEKKSYRIGNEESPKIRGGIKKKNTSLSHDSKAVPQKGTIGEGRGGKGRQKGPTNQKIRKQERSQGYSSRGRIFGKGGEKPCHKKGS